MITGVHQAYTSEVTVESAAQASASPSSSTQCKQAPSIKTSASLNGQVTESRASVKPSSSPSSSSTQRKQAHSIKTGTSRPKRPLLPNIDEHKKHYSLSSATATKRTQASNKKHRIPEGIKPTRKRPLSRNKAPYEDDESTAITFLMRPGGVSTSNVLISTSSSSSAKRSIEDKFIPIKRQRPLLEDITNLISYGGMIDRQASECLSILQTISHDVQCIENYALDVIAAEDRLARQRLKFVIEAENDDHFLNELYTENVRLVDETGRDTLVCEINAQVKGHQLLIRVLGPQMIKEPPPPPPPDPEMERFFILATIDAALENLSNF